MKAECFSYYAVSFGGAVAGVNVNDYLLKEIYVSFGPFSLSR
jgi:hypothetical protein